MPQVCFYFQLHQPYRLEPFEVFDVGSDIDYFGERTDHNKLIFKKVANKSYIPMLSLLLDLINMDYGLRITLSASGVFLEQAKKFEPRVISLLKKLAETGQVEFLAETYYHSLASLYSPSEFQAQVDLQMKLLKELFNVTPTVFRNTELIYSNKVADLVYQSGFKGILTEAVDRYLGNRNRTQVFQSYTKNPLPLLLKHAPLSDDIAFRFSDKNWSMFPLHAEKYVDWLHDYYNEDIINLFMDFETFGEHQWEDTGIFDFFSEVVSQLSRSDNVVFTTPSQLIDQVKEVEQLPVYDVPQPISWADIDRDLTAWTGNQLQQDTLRLIYSLEDKIRTTHPPKELRSFSRAGSSSLIDTWRKLQTSDHFYYMCTKWAADGDVHAYFSPYDSPWEAYNRYTAVLADFIGKIDLQSVVSRK